MNHRVDAVLVIKGQNIVGGKGGETHTHQELVAAYRCPKEKSKILKIRLF